VHLDAAREAPRELRQDRVLELSLSRPLREASGDEERLALERHADPLELGAGRGERGRTRLARRARDRKGRRLDDERDPAATRDDLLQRTAGEREAKGFADRGAHVGERLPRGRGVEDNRVVGRLDDLQPRAGQERDSRQSVRAYALA
jgi:hypothetical protein